jgi:hypothetical protein
MVGWRFSSANYFHLFASFSIPLLIVRLFFTDDNPPLLCLTNVLTVLVPIPGTVLDSPLRPALPGDYSLSRPCIQRLVGFQCRKDGHNDTSGVVAIHVTTYCGFGNNWCQLLVALQFCLVTNITEIYVDESFCWLPANYSFHTPQHILIAVTANGAVPHPRHRWLNELWMWPDGWCDDFTWRYLAESVRWGVLQCLPSVRTDASALYLYMRGGDSTWGYPIGAHVNYAQPPCDFYLQVMRNFSRSKVLGDFTHPCTSVLIGAGAELERYNERRNVALMVNAKYIALAMSSRSHAVLALSPVWKRFWMFDEDWEAAREPAWWRGYTPLEFGDGWDCIATMEFRTNLNRWDASPSQVEWIRNSSCRFDKVHCNHFANCPPKRWSDPE